MLINNKFPKMDQATDGAGGAGGAGGAAGAQGSAAAAAQAWFQGADSETLGFIQNKGWDKKSASEAAFESIKSYREASKFIGVPPDQLLRMPKDAADEAGWNAVHTRLGRPQDAKGYDFSGIKFGDGTNIDEGFANFMREKAFAFNLSKDAAAGITQEFAKFIESAEQSEKAETAALLVQEREALAKNWGANMEANKFIAQRAAAALGVDAATIAALENEIGYSKVMNMFLNIGQKIGEDKFISGNREAGNGVMTRDQAVSRKAELMADKAWVDRYMKGGASEKREMLSLNTLIAAGQANF